MKHVTIGMIAAGALTLVSALPAQAMSRDQATTDTFISVETRYLEVQADKMKAERASMTAFISQTAAACSGSLPPILVNGTGTAAEQNVGGALVLEASFDLAIANLKPQRAIASREIRRLRDLHWTGRKVNREMAAEISASRQSLALKPSDLCVDIATAEASGWATVPAATESFLNQANIGAEPTLDGFLKELKPFLTTADVAGYARLKKLGAAVDREEQELSGTYGGRLRSVIVAT